MIDYKRRNQGPQLALLGPLKLPGSHWLSIEANQVRRHQCCTTRRPSGAQFSNRYPASPASPPFTNPNLSLSPQTQTLPASQLTPLPPTVQHSRPPPHLLLNPLRRQSLQTPNLRIDRLVPRPFRSRRSSPLLRPSASQR